MFLGEHDIKLSQCVKSLQKICGKKNAILDCHIIPQSHENKH